MSEPAAQAPAEESDAGVPTSKEYLGEPGPPLDRRAPFYLGFFGGLGVLVAVWLGTHVASIGSTLMLIVVALFLAAGLNPAVEFFERRMRRTYAVLTVILLFLAAVALFLVAIVPVIAD